MIIQMINNFLYESSKARHIWPEKAVRSKPDFTVFKIKFFLLSYHRQSHCSKTKLSICSIIKRWRASVSTFLVLMKNVNIQSHPPRSTDRFCGIFNIVCFSFTYWVGPGMERKVQSGFWHFIAFEHLIEYTLFYI